MFFLYMFSVGFHYLPPYRGALVISAFAIFLSPVAYEGSEQGLMQLIGEKFEIQLLMVHESFFFTSIGSLCHSQCLLFERTRY